MSAAREAKVMVRVSGSERAVLEAAAGETKQPLATFVRHAALRAAIEPFSRGTDVKPPAA